MKVLHVYRTFFPDTQGGAEETIRQICRSTASIGCEPRVFTPSPTPKGNVEVDGIPVVQVPLHFEIASCGFSLTSIPEFKRQVEWADVVHFHFPWPFADLLCHFIPSSKPTLVTYHSDVVRQQTLMKFYSPLMHRFLNRMDRIVATSENYVRSSNVLARYLQKVSVVPIGLDEGTYAVPSEDDISECRREYGEGFLFFVGVLRYYKGLHVLLDAAEHTDAEILIAGIGPLESELRQTIVERGLKNVKLLGFISDSQKAGLFKICRAVVFPSHVRSEAFGVTLLEGAMYGKPLITAETGTGTSYVNQHQETGLIVEADNPGALAGAISQLSDNESLAQTYGANARRRFESLFTAEKMAKQYVEIYGELVGSQ